MVDVPLQLGLHVAAPKHNDSFFALFGESMRECICTIYPIIPKQVPGLESYVFAWFTLFVFMLLVIVAALYSICALQECTKTIQAEVDRLTKKVNCHRVWLSNHRGM